MREPAHFSGICSLKPTSGRVPADGHLPPCVGPFSILGSIGPMARTIPDVELLFRTIAGGHPADPFGAPLATRRISVAEAKEFSIGWFEDDGLTPVTPETRQAVRDAAAALERQGFKIRPFRPASLEKTRKLWHIFFVQCGAMFYAPTIKGRVAELSPTFRNFLEIEERETPLTAESLLWAWAECDSAQKLLAEMQECLAAGSGLRYSASGTASGVDGWAQPGLSDAGTHSGSIYWPQVVLWGSPMRASHRRSDCGQTIRR